MQQRQMRTLATGVYLRNGDQVQLKFSCARIGARLTVSYPITRYSKEAKARAVSLRSELAAACESPGTNDALVVQYVTEPAMLNRLGISPVQDGSLAAACERHMARYDTATKNTRISAQRECNALLAHFGGAKLISTFANEFTVVRDWVLRSDASEAWRKKTGGRLKMILEDARRDGVISHHPLQSATWWKDFKPARSNHSARTLAAIRKTEPQADNRAFSDEEVERIITTPTHRPDELALVEVGFATGMRIGELFALAAEDVDLDAGCIYVDWNFTAGELGLPKFHKQRVIPLPRNTLTLRRQMKKYEGNTVKVPVILDGERHVLERTFLFRNTNQHGNTARQRRLEGQDLVFPGNDMYRKYFWVPHLEAAEVDYRPPYGMRHTFATNAIERDAWDYRDLAAVLGHTDPEVTRKRYVRTREQDTMARIQRLAAAR